MASKTILLILLGIALTSGQLFSKQKILTYKTAPSSQYNGCPSAPELAPLICKLLQQNMQLYYKPKLIKPSTYIPPLVAGNCETAESESPGQVPAKKPLVIPQAPELPPAVIPSVPISALFEEPAATINEPYEHSTNPETSVPNVPVAPTIPLPEIPYFSQIYEEKPIVIPQPPELPTFVMPVIPAQVILPELTINATPCDEEHPALVISPPAAPVLSPVNLPEFPVNVEIPSAPIVAPEIDFNLVSSLPFDIPQPPELPAFIMPEIPVQVLIPEQFVEAAPYPESEQAPVVSPTAPLPDTPDFEINSERGEEPEMDYNSVSYLPVDIPQPPELPAFVVPEVPVQVLVQESSVATAPCPENQEVPVQGPPRPIQVAPELPPTNLPEFPIRIEIPLEPIVAPDTYYNPVNYLPAVFPHPPELPAFVMPELSVELEAPCSENQPAPVVTIPEFIQPPTVIPAAPELPSVVLPEFPIHIEVSSVPVLPPAKIPSPVLIEQPFAEPYLTENMDYNTISYFPAEIPQPPELPAFVMSELPPVLVQAQEIPAPVPTVTEIPSPKPSEKPKEPCMTEAVVTSEPQLLPIPEPPKLPELVMPEIPQNFPIAKPSVPCNSPIKSAVEIGATWNSYYEKYFPSQVSITTGKIAESPKVFIPSLPADPNSFPLRCVYNLVKEHVIPNIASDRYRSLENIEILPPTYIPCD